MDRKTALKILDTIPWNRLRHRVKQPNHTHYKPRYASVALSEKEMEAVTHALTLLRNVTKVEHTMLLEGQKVEIGKVRLHE